MGKFRIKINASLGEVIVVNSKTSDSCTSSQSITVVHNGINKFVQISTSGAGVGSQNFSETITADTTYFLSVEGNNTFPNQNTFEGIVSIRVRENNSNGEILATQQVRRQHSNNFC